MNICIDDYITNNLMKEYTIESLTLQIECNKAVNDYYKEVSLSCLDLDNYIYEKQQEENTNQGQPVQDNTQQAKKSTIGNKFGSAIGRIVAAISRFANSFIGMLKNIFTTKDSITADDFKNSQTGQVKLQQDVNAINQAVDKEMLKGNKLIQKISSVTGASDEEIQKYINGASTIAKFAMPIAIPLVTAKAYQKISEKLMKKWSDNVKEKLKPFTLPFVGAKQGVKDGAKAVKQGVKDTAGTIKTGYDYVAGNVKKQEQIMKVTTHMQGLIHKATEGWRGLLNSVKVNPYNADGSSSNPSDNNNQNNNN